MLSASLRKCVSPYPVVARSYHITQQLRTARNTSILILTEKRNFVDGHDEELRKKIERAKRHWSENIDAFGKRTWRDKYEWAKIRFKLSDPVQNLRRYRDEIPLNLPEGMLDRVVPRKVMRVARWMKKQILRRAIPKEFREIEKLNLTDEEVEKILNKAEEEREYYEEQRIYEKPHEISEEEIEYYIKKKEGKVRKSPTDDMEDFRKTEDDPDLNEESFVWAVLNTPVAKKYPKREAPNTAWNQGPDAEFDMWRHVRKRLTTSADEVPADKLYEDNPMGPYKDLPLFHVTRKEPHELIDNPKDVPHDKYYLHTEAYTYQPRLDPLEVKPEYSDRDFRADVLLNAEPWMSYEEEADPPFNHYDKEDEEVEWMYVRHGALMHNLDQLDVMKPFLALVREMKRPMTKLSAEEIATKKNELIQEFRTELRAKMPNATPEEEKDLIETAETLLDKITNELPPLAEFKNLLNPSPETTRSMLKAWTLARQEIDDTVAGWSLHNSELMTSFFARDVIYLTFEDYEQHPPTLVNLLNSKKEQIGTYFQSYPGSFLRGREYTLKDNDGNIVFSAHHQVDMSYLTDNLTANFILYDNLGNKFATIAIDLMGFHKIRVRVELWEKKKIVRRDVLFKGKPLYEFQKMYKLDYQEYAKTFAQTPYEYRAIYLFVVHFGYWQYFLEDYILDITEF